MVSSLKRYVALKDWRLIVIESVSLILAILSAALLEAKFFQLFIHEEWAAIFFAVTVVFSVTFAAYVLADNMQAKRKSAGYIAAMILLIVAYAGVLAALLGMSNYTMTVSKTVNDVDKLKINIANVDSLPIVKRLHNDLEATKISCQKDVMSLQSGIDKLIIREQLTGETYVTKKQEYEKLKAAQQKRLDRAKEKFLSVRDREEKRLAEESQSVSMAGKDDGGMGALLARNPAILPMLALVILFIGRLSFSFEREYQTISNEVTMMQTETMTTTHEHKITFEMIPDDWGKAIELIVHERKLGNGTGVGAMVAKKFGKSEAWVSKSVKNLLKSGEPN